MGQGVAQVPGAPANRCIGETCAWSWDAPESTVSFLPLFVSKFSPQNTLIQNIATYVLEKDAFVMKNSKVRVCVGNLGFLSKTWAQRFINVQRRR